MNGKERLVILVKWLVVVAMPFFLGFTAIRLFVNNAEFFVRTEYAKENFPEDLNLYNEVERARLGLEPFSRAEREALALVAVDYLQRPAPAEEVIYLLEEQQLPGTELPLYNDQEVSHMIDVKRLTDTIARMNWLAAAIVLGGSAWLLLGPERRAAAYDALFFGGIASTGSLLFIGLFILLAWNIFFVQFHELLFPPGTWTFAYSDSLIRLFPEKFWFDFGVLLSGTALLFGIVVTAVGFLMRRRLL